MYSQEMIDSFCIDYEILSVRQLKRKYGLSQNEYDRLRRRLNLATKKKVFDGEFSIKLIDPNSRYYRRIRNGRYGIYKCKNGKSIYYTSCITEDLAKKTVERLKRCNWDKSQLPQIKKDLEFKKVEFGYKHRDFDFEGFKKDYDKLSMYDLQQKYNLKPKEYQDMKKYLSLGKKRYRKSYKKGNTKEIV